MGKKLLHHVNSALNRILTVIFLLIMCTGIYLTLDTWYVYRSTGSSGIARFKPEEVTPETVRELSGDVVAWIRMDDTTIDYPVCQREDDNLFYLNHDAEGGYSLAGSIFLDFRSSPDFSDRYSLIYGHHMAGGLMFGALDAFMDYGYFMSHRTGSLVTAEGEIRFRTAAFLVTGTGTEEIFNTDTDTDYADFLSSNAQICVPEDLSDHLLALTTCKDPETTDRMALILSLDGEAVPGQ